MIFGQTVKIRLLIDADCALSWKNICQFFFFFFPENRFINFIYSFLTSAEEKDRESFVCI